MEGSAGFRTRRGWLLVVAALTAGQGWLTLRLFAPDRGRALRTAR